MVAMIFSLTLCGCSSNNSGGTGAKTDYVVFDVNSEQLDKDVLAFVKGTLYTGSSYFNAGIAIDSEDRYNRTEIISKYTCENAVYYKLHITDGGGDFYCMYRFQMGTEGKIESYIKYVVEA